MGARGPGARKAAAKRPQRSAVDDLLSRFVDGAPSWQAEGISRAERMCRFIETLKITSGPLAGQNFKLRPWQRELIEDWYRVDDQGKRIVRTAVLSVGRKNGKSTLVAAIAVAHLLGPEKEPRGQVVIGASDRDQSGIIFDEVCAMIDADPDLAPLVNIKQHEKMIVERAGGSQLRALSSDAKKAHGLSPAMVVLDEVGQWGTGVGTRLYNALMTAGGGRAEPLKIVISTQAEDDTAKLSELLDYGRQVNEGVIDNPGFSCRLYAVPDGLDPFDETHWPLANPGLGDFRSIEDMRELAERAKRMPSERSAFENLFLNRRIAAEERWIGKLDWEACRGPIDAQALVGQPCYGGLDLGSVSDLSSFTLYFPAGGQLLSWSWCPADRIAERSERDRVPYDAWAREGFIELAGGKAQDKRAIALRLAELNALYKPKTIEFDKWAMAELIRIIEDEGVVLPLHEHRQGYLTMSPATKAFEGLVLNKKLRHDNPLLTWALSNVRLERDAAGNVKPSKGRSREKIDPIVAGIMAVGAWSGEATAPDDRLYSDRMTSWLNVA